MLPNGLSWSLAIQRCWDENRIEIERSVPDQGAKQVDGKKKEGKFQIREDKTHWSGQHWNGDNSTRSL